MLLVGFGNVNFVDKTGKFFPLASKGRPGAHMRLYSDDVCAHACLRYLHNRKCAVLDFINHSSNSNDESVISMNIVCSALGFVEARKLESVAK